MSHIKRLIGVALLCCVLLVGCVPSSTFLKQQEQGLYPNSADFPNTKWVCRDMDISMYMFGYEEDYITGVYQTESQTYRVVGAFEFDTFDLSFYSTTDVSVSAHSDTMVCCEPNEYGHIITNYCFEKDTETIVCTVRSSTMPGNETIPKTLTFEKAGAIAQTPDTRWRAQEIDMYLDSFTDVDGYLRGEMTLGDEKHYVHALELGNNNYFMLAIENGKINNLRAGTTSPLIYLYFEKEGSEMRAKVCDSYLSQKELFSYWVYGDIGITFSKAEDDA